MHENLVANALRRNVPVHGRADVLARVRSARRSGFDAAPHEPAHDLWTLSVPLPMVAGPTPVSLSIVTTVQRARRESVRLALFQQVTALAKRLAEEGHWAGEPAGPGHDPVAARIGIGRWPEADELG
jgi:DNA-binding IclR family transcriptional regulator